MNMSKRQHLNMAVLGCVATLGSGLAAVLQEPGALSMSHILSVLTSIVWTVYWFWKWKQYGK